MRIDGGSKVVQLMGRLMGICLLCYFFQHPIEAHLDRCVRFYQQHLPRVVLDSQLWNVLGLGILTSGIYHFYDHLGALIFTRHRQESLQERREH